MDWDELEKKHMKEWGEFAKLKDEAWQQMRQNHEAMRAAFGDKEHEIPASVYQKIAEDKQAWEGQWGANGPKAQGLIAAQRAEVDQQKKKEAFKARFRAKGDKEPEKD